MDSYQGNTINENLPIIDDKYIIMEPLASGGMGEVYLAYQKTANQKVAIKKLKREYYQDQVAVKRFINEAHLYGQVTHPNAVKLHDVLTVDGQLCIVMEYVAGKTLAQYMKSGYVFSTRQIIDIALQIADALATFHQARIIHRDLKPDNVMLIETVPGRFSVKILDFGIAKLKTECSNNTLTQNGTIVGTPMFMSPEQCYGQEIDFRSDIYSFGILLFVMICNRLPYDVPNPVAIIQKQVAEPLPEMTRLDSSNIPLGLECIVRKCTMKKADDRYQSFMDVIADLTALQEGRKTSVELEAVSRPSTTKAKVNSEEAKDTNGKSRTKRHLIIRNVVLLATVTTIAIFIYIHIHNDNSTPPENSPSPTENSPSDEVKIDNPQPGSPKNNPDDISPAPPAPTTPAPPTEPVNTPDKTKPVDNPTEPVNTPDKTKPTHKPKKPQNKPTPVPPPTIPTPTPKPYPPAGEQTPDQTRTDAFKTLNNAVTYCVKSAKKENLLLPETFYIKLRLTPSGSFKVMITDNLPDNFKKCFANQANEWHFKSFTGDPFVIEQPVNISQKGSQ